MAFGKEKGREAANRLRKKRLHDRLIILWVGLNEH